jgi:hypothetical protein
VPSETLVSLQLVPLMSDEALEPQAALVLDVDVFVRVT